MHPPLPERISPHFCLGCSASVAPRVSLHQSQSASSPACQSFSEKREVVRSFHQPYKDIFRKLTVSLLLLSSFSVLLLWNSPIVKKHLSFIAIFFLLACELLKAGLNSPFPLHLNIFIPQLHLPSWPWFWWAASFKFYPWIGSAWHSFHPNPLIFEFIWSIGPP